MDSHREGEKSEKAKKNDKSKEESSESEVEEYTDEEVDVEEAYEQLYQDCRKLHKQNGRLTVKNKMLKNERDNLKIALEELQEKFETLKTKHQDLEVQVHKIEDEKRTQNKIVEALREKLGAKDHECLEAQKALQELNEKLKIPSNNLHQLLAIQRSPDDKRGLGYTRKKETKEESSTSQQKKIKVLKIQPQKTTAPLNTKVPPPPPQHKKGNQSRAFYQKPKGMPPNFQRKFVPICFHCGISGHIRPHCHKLYGLPLTYVDTRSFMKPNFRVSNRFDPLRFQESYFDSRPYMNWPVRKNKKKNFSKPIGPKPNNPKTQNDFPKTRTVWVRKSDLYVTHTPKNVEGVSLDM